MQIQKELNLSLNNIKKDLKVSESKVQTEVQPVARSIYNSTCPISPNYFNPSFGLRNPEKALERSQKLKGQYAKQGLTYLLANETWSNKRIFKTLDRVANKFDELSTKNDLSKKSLNAALAGVLPSELAKKIKVGDFMDLIHDLRDMGYSPDEINNIVYGYSGMASHEADGSVIFLPVNREINDKAQRINLKSTLLHELKHALTKQCTNLLNSDKYQMATLKQSSLVDETQSYNKMFMDFEKVFQTMADGSPIQINKENMIQTTENKNTGLLYDNEKELLTDMEKEVSKIIQKEIEKSKNGEQAIPKLIDYGYVDEKTFAKVAPDGVLTDRAVEEICKLNPKSSKQIKSIIKANQLPDDAFKSKTFWTFMQHRAKDEKDAYRTESVLREITGNKKQSLDWELQSLVYGEMEKFFREKAKIAE